MKTLKPIAFINTVFGRALIAKDKNLVLVIITNDNYEVFKDDKKAIEYIKSIRLTKVAA